MFWPGGWEWVVIFVVALIVFGPKQLPEIGKQIGKCMRAFREAAREVQGHLNLDDFDSPPPRRPPRRVEPPSIPSAQPSEGSSEYRSEEGSEGSGYTYDSSPEGPKD